MPDQSWDRLIRAHRAAKTSAAKTSAAETGATETGASGPPPSHEPTAAILACSDARVPPSIIFNQPAGTLFVVRIAGNTACPSALASLDYAVDVLGVDLIVVLGHTGCGAVRAAVDGTCGGYLAPVVAPICELARTTPEAGPDDIVRLNVANTVGELVSHDGPVGHAAAAHRLEIRGAVHDLRSGRLEPLTTIEPNQLLSPVEAS